MKKTTEEIKVVSEELTSVPVEGMDVAEPTEMPTPKKTKKTSATDTKALKKEIAALNERIETLAHLNEQMEILLDTKKAELDKATKVIERLSQEYSRRTRFILNTITQAHQAINMALEEK